MVIMMSLRPCIIAYLCFCIYGDIKITQTSEIGVDMSNHKLREKIHDWYAHHAQKKDCELFESCKDFAGFLKWRHWSCAKCNKSGTKIPKYLKENLLTRISRRKAFQRNKFKFSVPENGNILVFLDKYKSNEFVFGLGRSKKDIFDSMELKIDKEKSSYEIKTEDKIFPLGINDIDEAIKKAEKIWNETFSEVMLYACKGGKKIRIRSFKSELNKKGTIFEIEVNGELQTLNTTDFDEAINEASRVWVETFADVMLYEHKRGKKIKIDFLKAAGLDPDPGLAEEI